MDAFLNNLADNIYWGTVDGSPLRKIILVVCFIAIILGMWFMRGFILDEIRTKDIKMDKKHIPDVLIGSALIFMAVAAVMIGGDI